MRLIAGLGNPGKKFCRTRHNVGFMILDAFLGDVNWGKYAQGMLLIRDNVVFCKPLTYMNLSGEFIEAVRRKCVLKNDDILVICDDLYLPEGTFRFGINRSHGGHNGLRNMIFKLGGKDFCTLRIGIGPRERAVCISEYVMEEMNGESRRVLEEMYPDIFASLRDFSEGMGILELQNKYNRK